ncbi:MAG: acetyl-CoA decarbonylase/synthase complex subunit gamma [Phycisphaerae bacterium]|nr:acetyl-CoA decarbonylase/synthase complex subunit gamma [Phycisphaerae bacterium]
MALTGLEIFKQLPKTNCKDCGLPTCLAFAMKVAQGQAGLDACPHVSDDARSNLEAASAPPQRLVQIGEGDKAVKVGQEVSLFRHDDKFNNPTAIALRIADNDADIDGKCAAAAKLSFVRMGMTLTPDLIAVHCASGDAGTFAGAVAKIDSKLGWPMMLCGDKPDVLKAGAAKIAGKKPLICPSGGNPEDFVGVAKEAGGSLALMGTDPAKLAELTTKIKAAGLEDLFIGPGHVGIAAALEFLTKTRRAAVKKNCRELGYPVVTCAIDEDPQQATVNACAYVLKYGGVVVTEAFEPWQMLAILTTRQNIYTDPQKPVQVEPKIYEIGDPGDTAPVLITTNFSLSYYSVESEVESSRVPARIIAVDTEGTSVLTAWAADKFNAETITEAIKKSSVEGKVKHKKVVIPGHVAVLSAGIEDESGWTVMIGPKEASGLVPFLKNDWKP